MNVNVPDADEWTSFAVTAAYRAEVAVLDPDGVIVAVNEAWTDFARRNGCTDPARCGPGASYLAVCDSAEDDVADAVAAGIRQAVAGALPVPVRLTVPCDSPDRSRLFVTLVSSRFGDDGQCLGACVVLVPVADLPREAGGAGDGDARIEGRTCLLGTVDHAAGGPAVALPVEALTPLGEPTPDGWLAVDAGGRILAVNQRLQRLSGYPATELARLAAGDVDQVSELHLYRRRDGSQLWAEARACRVELPDVEGPLALVHLVDVSARDAARTRLSVSEASFRTVFDQAPVGALVARVEDDGRRRIVRANAALAETLGKPADALIGGDLSSFVNCGDADQAVAGLTDVAGGRSPQASGVWRFQAGSGSWRWLDVRIVPVELPDLTGPLVLAYLADVTQQQQALEDLAVSDASFRTVFDRSPIAAVVVRLNPDRPRLVRANRAAARLFGDSVEALIASDRSEFTPPGDCAVGDRVAALAADAPQEYSAVRRYRRRDGSPFWAELHAVPIRLPDLPGPLALVHLVDVTERRMAEARRAHAAEVDQLIAKVVTAVLADQPLPATYQQVADGVADVFCAEDVTVILPDPAMRRFTIAGAHGPVATDLMRSDSLAAQDSLTWLTAQAGQGVIIPASAPGLPAQVSQLGSTAATRFGAPPADRGGVLIAARARGKEPFTTDEVDLLTSLARQLTLAIRLGQTQSEQRRQAAERDAYLRGLEDVLRPLSDPADIQTVACHILGQGLRASRVFYAELEEGPVAVIKHEYLDGVDSITGRRPVDTDIEAALQTRGESLIVDDVSTAARLAPATRRLLLSRDVAAGIIVPLMKSGGLVAELAVHSSRPRHWTELEVQLTFDTAERTWDAVQRSLAERASAAERVRRQTAEHELVEQTAREQRERLEQEFITNAAHELRTPLTGILAAVDALDAGASDDASQRDRFLTHLRRESTRLARLSDSLLLLAQAQSLGPPPSEPLAVADLLHTVAAGLQVADTVALSLDADPGLTLRANPGLSEVLVGNLAANAARYTTAGHVRLSARTEHAAVVVEVDDTGPGMDEATLSRARDRFYRHTTSRDGDGFGLGLSIAAQAAAAMGATLDLSSTPGVGTRARITFPTPDSEPPPTTPAQRGAPHGTPTR